MTMGNKTSDRSNSKKPHILEIRDIPSIAKYIKSEECKNVFVMVSSAVDIGLSMSGIELKRSDTAGRRYIHCQG